MTHIENRILSFSSLSTDEQREVEAYVEAHPEWRSFLDEVKALEAIRNDVPFLHDIDDEALAYYAVASHSKLGASAALQRVFEKVEAQLSADSQLRERYESLVHRLSTFTDSFDPYAQFQSLSGFRLEAEARLPQQSEGRQSEGVDDRSARNAAGITARLLDLPRAVRWAAAAVVLVGLLYGGLYGVSRFTQSSAERLALVDLSETQIQGYQLTTRGAPATDNIESTDALYLDALQTLREARVSTLGLFPRYESGKLARAEELLQQVIEQEEAGSFLQVEAHFFLGKVHLAQGEIEAARSNFRSVAIHEGRRSLEATEILTKLQEEYPAHGQGYIG
jgi:TolA-binding protein